MRHDINKKIFKQNIFKKKQRDGRLLLQQTN